MKKTAVVYDKWLSSLGGGEVVACNIAKTLIKNNYQTIFICGKKTDPKIIKEKLGIDISKAKFLEIWNDETEIKKITRNKDIFINASFMDYTTGLAKKNIFYTSFPTPSFNGIKGKLINLFLPIISFFIKSREDLTSKPYEIFKHGQCFKKIANPTKIAFSNLSLNKKYYLKWTIFLENFSKSNLENINWNIDKIKLINQKIEIDHFHNLVKIRQIIKSTANTCYLTIQNKSQDQLIYLTEPKILLYKFLSFYPKFLYQKINTRLRAGVFGNLIKRMKSFNIVFANSRFTQKWIKNYWKRDSIVLYPPIPFIGLNSKIKKQNKICSVGRFFTLGHSKKQEIMIEAFKKMVDNGLKGWELHLAGGLGSEPSSIEYSQKIQKSASDYPIYFHFNQSRKFIEKLYQSSKIYWHAAGFGENESKNPIKFEHFGITPIEAMSAGCIPVIYNGGGLPDSIGIVGLNKKLHLFNSIEELSQNTQTIINKNIKLNFKKISKIIEQKFSQQAFQKNFRKYL